MVLLTVGPWVGNCVGYFNHKYFILFLFYASVCLAYFLILMVMKFYFGIANRQAVCFDCFFLILG